MQPEWHALIDQTVKDKAIRNAYDWQPLAKGSSNTIFLGHLKAGRQYTGSSAADHQSHEALRKDVLRINAPARDTPGVCREREATILRCIAAYPWAPTILKNSTEQGWCLMRYYEPASLGKQPEAECLPKQYHQALLTAVNDLHSIDFTANNTGSEKTVEVRDSQKNNEEVRVKPETPVNLQMDYEALLDKTYLPIAKKHNDTQALEWIYSIKHDLVTLPQLPTCLVHQDLHVGNLVFSAANDHSTTSPKTHTLTLLDWEYAAIGNPWFDAACLSHYLSIPADKIHTLTAFRKLEKTRFKTALIQANQMTENLENLWYKIREHQPLLG